MSDYWLGEAARLQAELEKERHDNQMLSNKVVSLYVTLSHMANAEKKKDPAGILAQRNEHMKMANEALAEIYGYG